MVTNLRSLLPELVVEKPIAYQRLGISPLRFRNSTELEYLILGDGISEELIRVEETSAAGCVPELRVRNRAKQRVLIPEGTTLIGAKQNRVVNLTILLAPESVTVIPVSCIERGRWHFTSSHFSPGHFPDRKLRALMTKDATASLKKGGKVQVDQRAVWDHVEDMLCGAGAASPTRAYHALYEKSQPELADYAARLSPPDGACGVAVEVDGVLQAVDLFDKPQTFSKLWPRLVHSYALSALRPAPAQAPKTDVKAFLDGVLRSDGEPYDTVGLGTNIRLTTNEAIGAALVCDGHLVHLSLFANEVPALQGGEAELPDPPGSGAVSNAEQGRRDRPWWKFWG